MLGVACVERGRGLHGVCVKKNDDGRMPTGEDEFRRGRGGGKKDLARDGRRIYLFLETFPFFVPPPL